MGLGIGWRPELALAIDRHPGLGFVELMAEDFDPQHDLPEPVRRLIERGLPLIPHGVSLSLGGAEPPEPRRIAALTRLAERVKAPLVSEHLAFVRGAGIETGHLLPVPYSRAMLDVVVENIVRVKRSLPVPLALENIATLFEWPDVEMEPGEFLREVLERTDTLLLLDVENVYANARSHWFDAETFLDRLPLERIAYIHVAGGFEQGGIYHDTHTRRVPDGVLDLLTALASRAELPGVMLERDDDFPPEVELRAELESIRQAVDRGRAIREALHVSA
jgi:uncharacterized protein (UPF0276 family)